MNGTAQLSTSQAKVALITGASGGLGQGLVAAFAGQGWRVVAASHRAGKQSETAAVWPTVLDVTNRARAEAVVVELMAKWGRIDVLVNNAGVTGDQLVAQMSEADWDRVVSVNLKGAFLCSQAVLRTMTRQGGGQIINISSHSARVGHRGQANYAAAKAGLIGLTTSLAREMGSRNIRVNAILPGVLSTPMTATLTDEQRTAFATANALGRWNSIDEVARFIVFLTGTENISGQIFQLDSRVARWT